MIFQQKCVLKLNVNNSNYFATFFHILNPTATYDYIIALGIVDMVFYSIVVAVFLMKKAPILIGDIWESYYKLYNFDFINLLKKKKKKRGEHGGSAMPL